MKRTADPSHWPLTLLLGSSSILNLFLPLFLVRLLAPEEVGLYKLFFLYAAAAPWILLAAGFGNGMYYWAGQPETRQNSFSATWSLQICWALGVVVLGACLWPFLASSALFQSQGPLLFALMILSIALAIPSPFYEESQIALGKPGKGARYAAGWEFLRTFTLIATALYHQSVLALVIASVAILTLKVLISTILVLRSGSAKFFLFKNPQTEAVLRYAMPSSGAAALAVILGYCDQFILGQRLTAAQFAVYSLGCLSIPPLLVLEQSVNKILLPPLTSAMIQSTATAWQLVRRSITDLGLWLIPASWGLFFFAGPITRLLFTDRYPETEFFLKIYAFSYLVYVIPWDAWARSRGLSTWILRTSAVFAVISLTGTYLGAVTMGAYGALVLFILAQFALRFYSLSQMKRRLGWSLRQLLPLKLFFRASLASVFLGFLTSSGLLWFSSEVVGLLVMGSLFWILYVAFCVPWAARQARRENPSYQVLMLTPTLNIGGLERMILNLSHCLRDRSLWRASIFVYDQIPGAVTLDSSFKEVPVTRSHKGPGFSLKLCLQLAQHCRHQRIDVIHAHDLGALIYASFAKILSLGRVRLVYTQHSSVHLKNAPKYRVYEKAFSFFADEIVTVSNRLKEIYVEMGIAANRVSVIENGIPFADPPSAAEKLKAKKVLLGEFAQKFQQQNSKVIEGDAASLNWILNLARLHPGKGQEEVLQIWAGLESQVRQNTLLFFVGGETSPGALQMLEEKARRLPDSQNIFFMGASLQPQVWLQASDLFISASLEEGMPLSPLEALAMNVPLFLSHIEGHKMLDAYCDYFDLQNLEQAAALLQKKLLRLKNTDNNFAASADVLARFSLQKMTEAYAELYLEKKRTAFR